MNSDFATWARHVGALRGALEGLARQAQALGAPDPAGQPWYDLLRHKLGPQLELPPMLIAAVVGGTNIGKSLLFNQLAGEVASTVSPLAAGTRHPVCLTPADAADPELLGRLFEPFTLRAWSGADDALADTTDNLLFWRVGRNVPARLLLLDTPDVDSDAMANWQRARAIRETADVLIAVLTQQKYNDAAVKQFFREAAAADKPVIIVFNQVDLEGDGPYWPMWLETFTRETGVRGDLVYVVPYDRQAAAELRLPVYSVGCDGRTPPGSAGNLREELARLHFDSIKIRTFRGAIQRVLDRQHGAGAYLDAIRLAAGGFSAAGASLSEALRTRIDWPTLPSRILVDEIRTWWDADRSPFSRNVHGLYRVVGQGLTWPVRKAWQRVAGPPGDPLADFRQRERQTVLLAVERLLGELERLAELGNTTLQPRLRQVLSGHSRQELLVRVQAAHEQLPAVDDDYRDYLRRELDVWKESNPSVVGLLRKLDFVLALARPAITVTLAASGWLVAGGVVGHVATETMQQTASHLATEAAQQAAGHTAGHLATELLITGGVTGGGEVMVGGAVGGIRGTAARLLFHLQERYTQQRAQWLEQWLHRELLGSLIDELRTGAAVPDSPAFRAVETALAALAG